MSGESPGARHLDRDGRRRRDIHETGGVIRVVPERVPAVKGQAVPAWDPPTSVWPLSPGSPPGFAPHRHDRGSREGIRRISILPLPRHPHQNQSGRAGRLGWVSNPDQLSGRRLPHHRSTLGRNPEFPPSDLDQLIGRLGGHRTRGSLDHHPNQRFGA